VATRITDRYFTGKPCKNGHVGERYRSNNICVECASEHWRRQRERNPEGHRRSSREYARKNREKETERQAIWYHNNKDARAKWIREYRKRPEIAAKRTAEAGLRRAAKRQACPKWVDKKALAAVYAKAREKSDAEGTRYHVDHIVPLLHPLVCGLHVPWNLQVLSAGENLQKSNSFSPEVSVQLAEGRTGKSGWPEEVEAPWQNMITCRTRQPTTS